MHLLLVLFCQLAEVVVEGEIVLVDLCYLILDTARVHVPREPLASRFAVRAAAYLLLDHLEVD